ncbi:MAG: DUF465 domain-containing protein [Proteobacteria bacterium]|nr:DUF465 domain-containing protein [Pseudomonadota bacterium]
MEAADKMYLEQMLKRDVRLQRLFTEHERFEVELQRFYKRPFLTESEEAEQRLLKRKKLAGVDKIMAILAEHRASGAC